jgi:hypothetical protein
VFRILCIFLAAALAAVLGAAGCGDKTQAHLERFLDTKEKAPEAEKPAAIDAFAVADNPEVADRVHTMKFSEVAQRLGAHRLKAQIRFDFVSPETRAWLREDSLIVQAADGDFRVKVENDGGEGYELIYADERFFARNRFGPFHERNTISSDHQKWRDAAHGSWAAIYRLYRGRLRFSKLGLTRYHGRDAIRFSIGFSKEEPRLTGTPEPPQVPKGVEKYVYPIEPTPSDTHRWRDHAQPKTASGTVLVDADVGVVLNVDFKGELALPAPGSTHQITLSIQAELMADSFGNPASIAPPAEKDVKPIPERIPVDTHPLDFYFGKGFTASLGAPAGVAADRDKKKDPKKKEKSGGSASKP